MNRSNPGRVDRSITAGSDFLQLDVGDAPAGGRADWLTRRLREAIADGRLPVGGRLPATRVLAAELGVSRGVVTEAYQRLAEDGHVVGRGRGGTVVVAAPRTGEGSGEAAGRSGGSSGAGVGAGRESRGLAGSTGGVSAGRSAGGSAAGPAAGGMGGGPVAGGVSGKPAVGGVVG
ncbi:GntR family transcriptional regulator, partial [Saccharothrix saharensis]|uniref:GntR family transcriptional regulator n=1 Tax=Saccharothrix saharensis TaxID=571190 RepID=UPI0036807986